MAKAKKAPTKKAAKKAVAKAEPETFTIHGPPVRVRNDNGTRVWQRAEVGTIAVDFADLPAESQTATRKALESL